MEAFQNHGTALSPEKKNQQQQLFAGRPPGVSYFKNSLIVAMILRGILKKVPNIDH